MRSYQISVPSKTFLLGEYIVLQGGPAMLLTTAPRFTLLAVKQLKSQIKMQGIHKDSPAGKFVKRYAALFQAYSLNFVDEYHGLGGFGASGAQFLMVAVLKQYLDKQSLNEVLLLKEYQTFAWDGKGCPPSGVDLIAQMHGGICYFYKMKNQIQTFSWPFQDLDYGLIHTGNKLATHEHLKQLAHLNVNDLEKIVIQGKLSMEQQNSQSFLDSILNYTTLLMEKNLMTTQTQMYLKQLTECKGILAKKGCGALGADVIVIFFKRGDNSVINWLREKKFNVITYGHHVEKGLDLSEI
jgi:mevalonate kinase